MSLGQAQHLALPTFTLTENALAKIQSLIQTKNNDQLNFRIAILPGGCSGFQYQFSLEEQEKFSQDDDMCFSFQFKDTILQCVTETQCLPYLKDAVINYKTSLQGSQFTVENPNAESTCGCGVSFCLK